MNLVAPKYGRPQLRPHQKNAYSGNLAPTWLEIFLAIGLFFYYFIADAVFGSPGYYFFNFTGPMLLVGILGYGNWQMIRNNGKNLWTALFWFRLSTAIYFGIGTLYVYLADDMSSHYMQSFYKYNDADIFKLNLIAISSVILVLIFTKFTLQVIDKIGNQRATTRKPIGGARSGRGLLYAAILFLGIGLTLNYVFALPYRMGWSQTTLPGFIFNLSKLSQIGIFFAILWALRHSKKLLPIIFVLVFIEMFVSSLMFAKTDVLFIVIMVLLAFLWDRVTITKLISAGTLVVAVYFILTPIVNHGRSEIALRYGSNTQAGLVERSEVLFEYFIIDPDLRQKDDIQGEFSRLSYVSASTFVIHLYDTGHPGDWPKILPAVFVPRLLWPEKPIVTNIGRDINELATGRRTSSVGAGVFADTYWAMGWLGVILFMSVYGIIIGGLTRFTFFVMRDERWIYFPVVLIALRQGLRTDGHYIADVAGNIIILAAMYVLLRIMDMSIKLFAHNL